MSVLKSCYLGLVLVVMYFAAAAPTASAQVVVRVGHNQPHHHYRHHYHHYHHYHHS
ncbi:uncharacterized protein YjlB [Edaphobacter lichenicola]|uniref:Uncharacterized protein YjlB n=1 Tax=Tunturiibacter gelidiferens TaxID=3069689 RepID=A0A9X0QJQ1_9BACT|nr:uncharacterized protein YjlB [Edaphobacter lichenicola]